MEPADVRTEEEDEEKRPNFVATETKELMKK